MATSRQPRENAYDVHPAIKQSFYSDLMARKCGFKLEERAGFRMAMDFFEQAAERFDLDISAAFNPWNTELLNAVLERYPKLEKFFGKLSHIKNLHHFSDNLYPENWQDLQEFADILTTIIHFGQRRKAEKNRRYIEHLDEVRRQITQLFEGFSNSVVLLAQLHDCCEDFFHKNSVLRAMGLKEAQCGTFLKFMLEYFDRVFPSLEYPLFFEDQEMVEQEVAGFRGSFNGAVPLLDLNKPFKDVLSEKLKFSDALLLLSKIEGDIPGDHKDRYRDLLAKLEQIFNLPDVRLMLLAFSYYFNVKACDVGNNFLSYTIQSDHSDSKQFKSMTTDEKRKAQFKDRQMRGMAQWFFLRVLQESGAVMPDYYLRDGLRFPEYHKRREFSKLIKDYEKREEMQTYRAAFKRELEMRVSVAYRDLYGEDLAEDDFEIQFWRREMKNMQRQVTVALDKGEALPENNFLNVVVFLVLTKDPVKVERIRAIAESSIAVMAPVEESYELEVERKHPFIGKYCNVRSDRGFGRDKGEWGMVVYSVPTLAEARRFFSGAMPAMFLENDPAAFADLAGKVILPLKGRVSYLQKQLQRFEKEIAALANNQVEPEINMLRFRFFEVFRPFLDAVMSKDDLPQKGLLGDIPRDETFVHYVKQLLEIYSLLKEQAMILMIPSFKLAGFNLSVCGDDGVYRDFSVPVDQISLPKNANVLYALFYFFPELFGGREFESVEVKRNVALGLESPPISDPEKCKILTLRQGDQVSIKLGQRVNFECASLTKLSQMVRSRIYPDEIGPAPEY